MSDKTETVLHDIAAEGRKVVAQTAAILNGVGHSTETAVNEVFAVLQALSDGDDALSEEAQAQLLVAMNALQYQDIVTQQISAIQALMQAFDDNLASYAEAPDEADLEVDVEGAFDATADFDRDRADVDDLDAWINEAKEDGE